MENKRASAFLLIVWQDDNPPILEAGADGLPTVFLQHVKTDKKAVFSLISEAKARDTNGRRVAVSNEEKQEKGIGYQCNQKVTLRWRIKNGAFSQYEEFYIVDRCPDGLDAVYGAGICRHFFYPNGPQVKTLQSAPLSNGKSGVTPSFPMVIRIRAHPSDDRSTEPA